MSTLETPRLILRRFTLEDASEFERLITPFVVTDGTLSFPHPVPEGWGLERIGLMLERLSNGEHSEFAICDRASGALMGGIGLSLLPRHHRGHLGYWLGVDFWNQGFATEAVRAVVEHGFQTLDLHRIEASHYPRNPASGRVLEKCGFGREGVLRGYLFKNGVPEDTVMYGLVRSDWNKPG